MQKRTRELRTIHWPDGKSPLLEPARQKSRSEMISDIKAGCALALGAVATIAVTLGPSQSDKELVTKSDSEWHLSLVD